MRSPATLLGVGVGLVAVCTLVAALAGSPGTGLAVGVGLLVPAAMFTAVTRRRLRDPHETTDERAQIIDLTARAHGFLALVGMLFGVIVYRWIADGFDSAETYVSILSAGVLVQYVTQYHLRRRR
jgi:hypothetical protein